MPGHRADRRRNQQHRGFGHAQGGRTSRRIGIVIADSLLGEITPAMAAAVCQSSAARVLIPINHCDNIVVGVPDQPIGQLVAAAVEKVKELIR